MSGSAVTGRAAAAAWAVPPAGRTRGKACGRQACIVTVVRQDSPESCAWQQNRVRCCRLSMQLQQHNAWFPCNHSAVGRRPGCGRCKATSDLTAPALHGRTVGLSSQCLRSRPSRHSLRPGVQPARLHQACGLGAMRCSWCVTVATCMHRCTENHMRHPMQRRARQWGHMPCRAGENGAGSCRMAVAVDWRRQLRGPWSAGHPKEAPGQHALAVCT